MRDFSGLKRMINIAFALVLCPQLRITLHLAQDSGLHLSMSSLNCNFGELAQWKWSSCLADYELALYARVFFILLFFLRKLNCIYN